MRDVSNFILFGGEIYYPSGGCYDIIGMFETIEMAMETAGTLQDGWWHVFDINKRLVVATSEQYAYETCEYWSYPG